VIKAAKYLGVAPWDLMDRPIAWLNWALESEAAEVEAKKFHQERQQKMQKRMSR
jgi:hypothetical protein